MVLKDSFYTLINLEASESELVAKIEIDAKHSIFDGHFPGNPVTPGVVQMELIKEILSTHFENKMELISMSACKFLAILNPETSPICEVKISFKIEEGNYKINAQIESTGIIYTKISAVYQLS